VLHKFAVFERHAAKNETAITTDLVDDRADICRMNAESRTKNDVMVRGDVY
jgi:hypothetical protein